MSQIIGAAASFEVPMDNGNDDSCILVEPYIPVVELSDDEDNATDDRSLGQKPQSSVRQQSQVI